MKCKYIYVYFKEPNVVLQTLVKKKIKKIRRAHARAHTPGAGAFLGPGAGQLWPPPHLLDSSSSPPGKPPRGPTAPQPHGLPARPPPHFLSGSTPPRARSLLQGRLRDPLLPEPLFLSGSAFPLKAPHGAPDRGRSATYSRRRLPGPPDVSWPAAGRSSLPSRAPRRAGASSASAPGGAYHSAPRREEEAAEGAGAVPFAARGTGLHRAEPGDAHTFRRGSGDGMGSTGPAQSR